MNQAKLGTYTKKYTKVYNYHYIRLHTVQEDKIDCICNMIVIYKIVCIYLALKQFSDTPVLEPHVIILKSWISIFCSIHYIIKLGHAEIRRILYHRTHIRN